MVSKLSIKRTILFVALIGIGISVCIFTGNFYQKTMSPVYMKDIFWPNPKKITAFTMTDQYQKEFKPDNLKGHWTLMFFGYTNCPDFCPTTMAVLNAAFKNITKTDTSKEVQIIFVTVDPERDSTTKIADYINHFNEKFIGLSGTQEQLDSLASQIGITYFYGPLAKDGGYDVSHTNSIFLLDPKARLISIFSHPFDPMSIQSRFLEIKKFISTREQY